MSPFFDRMLRAARLEPQLYEEVEHDPSALGQAVGVVVLSSVAAGVGHAIDGQGNLFVGIIGALIGWAAWSVMIWLVGTKLLPEPQTEADIGQLLRTIGFSAAPGVLRIFGFLPLIGGLVKLVASVWMLVAMIIAVRQALDYQGNGRAVLVCVIGWVVAVVIQMLILAPFALGAMFLAL